MHPPRKPPQPVSCSKLQLQTICTHASIACDWPTPDQHQHPQTTLVPVVLSVPTNMAFLCASVSLWQIFLRLSLTPSVPSHPSSSQTQSPPHTPHPHDESRPSPDHSSTPAQSAPPFLSFHPPPSPAPNVANNQSPLRRHYESTPTKLH